MIYTSGSTGKPKGVQIAHSRDRQLPSLDAARLGMTAGDRCWRSRRCRSISQALEFFLPLTVGARWWSLGRDVATDGARLIERLTQDRHHLLPGDPGHLAAAAGGRLEG